VPEKRYDFSYGPGTPYAHAMDLVARWRDPEGEVVVDLGCGFGAIAEPTRALGLAYLGLDREPAGVRSLAARGAEGHVADLSTPEAMTAAVTAALRGRRVAAFTMLDYAEHLADAAGVLAALSALSRSTGGAPLVVSIPNVSHRDLATKLLLGRWDVTPTGLLDETHLRFFAPATLERQMRESGWEQLDERDFELEESDQHFPQDCVALLPWTPLGAFLRRVRAHAAPGATTNQFVRAYRPVPPGTPAPSGPSAPGGDVPVLSAVVRAGRGVPEEAAALEATLRALEAQGPDVEVLLAGEPGAASAEGAGATFEVDAAIACARGRYVALLDAGDVPEPGWARLVADGAGVHPGRVLQVQVRTDRHDRPGPPRPAGLPGLPGLAGLVAEAPASLAPYAIPRSLFCDLGVRLGSDAGGAAADWVLLVRAVELCGLVALEEPGFRALGAPGLRTEDARAGAHGALLSVLDAEPLVLDRGSASALGALGARVAELERARAEAVQALEELRASTSWRLTAPLRAAMAWSRRVGR